VVPTPLHAPRLPTLLQALHLVVGTAAPATAPPLTNAAPATANALTSTRPIIRHSVFLAGVWGEASPQAPPEARWTVGRSRGASQPWAGGRRRERGGGEEERRRRVAM